MEKKRDITKMIIGVVIAVAGGICVGMTRAAGIAEGASTKDTLLLALSLIGLLLGVVVFFNGLRVSERHVDTKLLAIAAMMAALCYIGFALFKIDIPIPGSVEKTAFHLGNVFCVLAALLIGGLWGGLSGAVGMTIADMFTGYMTSAPKTFLLKLCIGLITGFVAHKILKIGDETDKKKLTWKTAVACACGMAFNVVADPLVGYFYKLYLFGIPQDIAKAFAKMSAVTTLVNAIVAVRVATLFYLALRPAVKSMGIMKYTRYASQNEKE